MYSISQKSSQKGGREGRTRKTEQVFPLYQRSSTLFLGTHYPEEFSYNPNQTPEAANQAPQDCLKIAGRCAAASWK